MFSTENLANRSFAVAKIQDDWPDYTTGANVDPWGFEPQTSGFPRKAESGHIRPAL
jgi:hypothetical protein